MLRREKKRHRRRHAIEEIPPRVFVESEPSSSRFFRAGRLARTRLMQGMMNPSHFQLLPAK
jgi:hypothetical protein